MEGKKTNRELFLDELSKMENRELVQYTDSAGKCRRCANYFWDGTQNGCHRNVNDSSCEKGMAEWMESYPGECLPVKYKKKYLENKSYTDAHLNGLLVDVLYESGVVKYLGRCTTCDADGCYAKHGCAYALRAVKDMRDRHIRRQVEDLEKQMEGVCPDSYAFTIKQIRDRYRHWHTYVEEILIPDIEEPELKGQAKLLLRMVKEREDGV